MVMTDVIELSILDAAITLRAINCAPK